MKTDIKFSERSILEDCNHWLLKKAFTVWCYYSFLFCYLVFCLRKIVCLKWNMFAKLPQTRMVNSMCVACLNNCMPFCQHCKDKQWRNVPTWRGSACKNQGFCKSWLSVCFADRLMLWILFVCFLEMQICLYLIVCINIWPLAKFEARLRLQSMCEN